MKQEPNQTPDESDIRKPRTPDDFIKEQFGLDISKTFQFGKHEILEWNDSGGQSKVFKARDIDLDRVVAIKYYHSATDLKQKERVLAEGRALAQIDHPHVARCYHVDTSAGAPFLVLEWVDGKTLDHYLESNAVGIQERRILFSKITSGVQALHNQNLLHADLKPPNIIVSPDGEPKVIDLGLTQNIGKIENGVSGTYAYMAPEVARNEPENVSVATDVFGLGGILYYMLTGQAVYCGSTKSETYLMAAQGEIVAPRQLVKEAPADLEELCLACLSELPENRPQDLNTLLRLVEDKPRYLWKVVATILVAAIIVLGIWLAPDRVIYETISDNEVSPEVELAMQDISGLDELESSHMRKALQHLFDCESLLKTESSSGIENYASALAHGNLAMSNIAFVTDGKDRANLDRELIEYHYRILDKLLGCRVRTGNTRELSPLVSEIASLAEFLYGDTSEQYRGSLSNQAAILLKNGQPTRAIEAIDRLYQLAKLEKNDKDRYYFFAMLLDGLYQAREYERIIELSANIPKGKPKPYEDLFLGIARVFVSGAFLETDDTDSALAFVHNAVFNFQHHIAFPTPKTPPQFAKLNIARAKYTLARIESKTGKHQAAIAATQSAIELVREVQPNSIPFALVQHARSQFEAGFVDKAKRSLEEALEKSGVKEFISSNSQNTRVQATIWSMLGEIEFRNLAFNVAKDNYSKAIDQFSKSTLEFNYGLLKVRVLLAETNAQLVSSNQEEASDLQHEMDTVNELLNAELLAASNKGKRRMVEELIEKLNSIQISKPDSPQ